MAYQSPSTIASTFFIFSEPPNFCLCPLVQVLLFFFFFFASIVYWPSKFFPSHLLCLNLSLTSLLEWTCRPVVSSHIPSLFRNPSVTPLTVKVNQRIRSHNEAPCVRLRFPLWPLFLFVNSHLAQNFTLVLTQSWPSSWSLLKAFPSVLSLNAP